MTEKRLVATIDYDDGHWWFYTYNVDICGNDSSVQMIDDWSKIDKIRRTLKATFEEDTKVRVLGGLRLEYYFDFDEWLKTTE